MKTVHFIIFLLLLIVSSVGAQEFSAPTKSTKDSTTTYTYRMESNIYNVYKSSKGAYYIYKTSKKTNKYYKYYLPKEIQIKMGRKYN